jgi:hypothetical protein
MDCSHFFSQKVVLTLGEGPQPHPLLLTLHRMYFCSLDCAVQRFPLLDFSIGLPLLNNSPAHVAPRASPEIGSTQQISFGVAISRGHCEIKKATRLVCALPRLCFSCHRHMVQEKEVKTMFPQLVSFFRWSNEWMTYSRPFM